MCACHVEHCSPPTNGGGKRGCEAKSKHLPKDTIPLGCACSEILRLRPTGFATNDEFIIRHTL